MTQTGRDGRLCGQSRRPEGVAMLTLSIIKADTGGFVGHSGMHPEMLKTARDEVVRATHGGLLVDAQVASCNDDISLIMTHRHGADAEPIHALAWNIFQQTTEVARDLGLYGAGQDILSDAFSGNLRGMGPGYAELEFEERPSETVLCFLADKTEPGAWNLPVFKMFADPFNHGRAGDRPEDARGLCLRGPRPVREPADHLRLPRRALRHAAVHRRTQPLRDQAGDLQDAGRARRRHLDAAVGADGRALRRERRPRPDRALSVGAARGRRDPRAVHVPPHGGRLHARLAPRPADARHPARRAPQPLRRPAARRRARLPDHRRPG